MFIDGKQQEAMRRSEERNSTAAVLVLDTFRSSERRRM